MSGLKRDSVMGTRLWYALVDGGDVEDGGVCAVVADAWEDWMAVGLAKGPPRGNRLVHVR